MGIDPNIGRNAGFSVHSSSMAPASGAKQKTMDHSSDTLSSSQQEAIMIQYLMNYPVLPVPNINGSYTIEPSTIKGIVATSIAEMGSKMWDSYLDSLAEQKKRIQEYLQSPQYLRKVEEKSSASLAKAELSSPVSEHQTKPEVWSHAIDGVSNYIAQVRDEKPEVVPFMVASFVIAGSFLGDYMNIVDVVSTPMVAVNPIQSALNNVVPLIPEKLQETFNLTINLLVIGLINYSTVEAVAKSMKSGEPPTTKDTVAAFARNVLQKVKSDEVNGLLMSILVNAMEEQTPPTEREMNKLTAIAKAVMVSVALAALYKVETGWIKSQEFRDMLSGGMKPRSEEEGLLVKYFQDLQQAGVLSKEEWNGLITGLGEFFDSNPSMEDLLNPTKVYANLVSQLTIPRDYRG